MDISSDKQAKSWIWLRKGNLKWETGFPHIAAQNNAMNTNSVKAKIDRMQQNSRCRLYVDRHETINHVISECIKLAQSEYQTRHDQVGKVIHRELCNKSKFDYTNECYMHNPKSVQENKTLRILWDFKIQTDYLISARQSEQMIIYGNKEPA